MDAVTDLTSTATAVATTFAIVVDDGASIFTTVDSVFTTRVIYRNDAPV